MRARLYLAVAAALTTMMAASGAVRAQSGAGRPHAGGDLLAVPLPGGMRAALATLDDRTRPVRSELLLDVIRRTHQMPAQGEQAGDNRFGAFLAHLDAASPAAAGQAGQLAAPSDTVPLPLPAAVWVDAVFGGRATVAGLVPSILRSRAASLFYVGLLALDPDTRDWLAGERALVRDVVALHSSAFLLAADGVRVRDARVIPPGGETSARIWEGLADASLKDPATFVRAVLARNEGRLAYFFGAMAALTPAQMALAFDLSTPDASADQARRLYAVFEHLTVNWRIESRAFARPALDPALLVADMSADATGRPRVPGTQRFWEAVFGGHDTRSLDARALVEGRPVGFAWLAERIFAGDPSEHRRRYVQVLYASRTIDRLDSGTARDVVEAVRASARYPALTSVLERMQVTDAAVVARAARRAAALADIGDTDRAARAITGFQSALAVLARAAWRGSLSTEALPGLVTSLAELELTDAGDYAGRLVRWLDTEVRPLAPAGTVVHEAAGPVERDLIALLSGRTPITPDHVEWEGTTYRVDLARGETARLTRLLGDEPRPWLSSSVALVRMADTLGKPPTPREVLRQQSEALADTAEAVGWTDDDKGWSAATVAVYRTAAASLEQAGRSGNVNAAARLAPHLLRLADDVLARGLLELVYATALGQPERAWFAASDAARGHDFGLAVGPARREIPWRLPVTGNDSRRDRYATGSLLGLDVRLAPLSLVRLSTKPPPRRPTLHEEHRRVFVEAIALVPPALSDADRAAMVAAIREGRRRLAGVRTAHDAAVLAAGLKLSATRQSLLPWIAEHEPGRLATVLSPGELLWLGQNGSALEPRWQAWGAPAESRLGCLCTQLLDRRPFETFAFRWGTGIFASAFPDLNLRLSELLLDLHMPAALLGPVLGAATLDFINGVMPRDQDDRRALVEFVQELTTERVEEYLALLTTDGPLVPFDGGVVAAATRTGGQR